MQHCCVFILHLRQLIFLNLFMMIKINFPIVLLLGLAFVFTACDKEDPVIANEEELITTLKYTLTPTNGGTSIELSFVDLDGDGGNAPVITGGTLSANQSYSGTLDLLNEAESPAESIAAEVAAEDKEHQFFFASTVNGVTVTYDDQDADGNPLGLQTTLTTGGAGTGTLTVVLRHEPNKSAAGVVEGGIENAGGETDIEVSFPIDVQ